MSSSHADLSWMLSKMMIISHVFLLLFWISVNQAADLTFPLPAPDMLPMRAPIPSDVTLELSSTALRSNRFL